MSNRRTIKATKLKISSAAKAKKYFKNKMACATGPVELERWVKQGEPVNIVDVRALEDYAEGHIPGAVKLPRPSGMTLTYLSTGCPSAGRGNKPK